MIFYYKTVRFIVPVLFAVLSCACMSDVDLGQASEISLRPKLEMDLLHFEIKSEDWIDPETNELMTILRDTVRLAFLDDDYIQKDLVRVDLSFRHSNSFSNPFSNRISFLSENNREQYVVDLYVDAGSKEQLQISQHTEVIDSDNIQVIKRSIKMAVEIERLPGEEPFVGELKFESKGVFFFEF